jgi:hypothetical protein
MNPTPTTRSWPILLLAAPAFVAIWSGWVGLGELTGFGPVKLLPGIWDTAEINSAITLPVGMETYAAYALHVMLSTRASHRARTFARWSAIGALALGAAGQVAYHLMSAAHLTQAPGAVTALVACLPVAVLGMGAALAHLVHDNTPTPMPSSPTPDWQADARPVTPDPTTDPQTGAAPDPTDAPKPPPRKAARPRPATTGQPGRTGPGTNTGAKVTRLRAKHPDLTQAEIAKELGVTERTVRRYWTTPTTAPTVLPTADPDGPAPTTTTTDPTTTEARDSASRAA